MRIEVLAFLRADEVHGFFYRPRLFVGPSAGQRIKDISQSGDTCSDGNFFSGHTVRVSATIPFFVVIQSNSARQLHQAGVAVAENARADLRMTLHVCKFFRGQLAWLE